MRFEPECAGDMLSPSGWASPHSVAYRVGTEGEVAAHLIAFTAGSTTQRLPPKKAARMGDEGKAVGVP